MIAGTGQGDIEPDVASEGSEHITNGGSATTPDSSLPSSAEVAQEQRDYPSLTGC